MMIINELMIANATNCCVTTWIKRIIFLNREALQKTAKLTKITNMKRQIYQKLLNWACLASQLIRRLWHHQWTLIDTNHFSTIALKFDNWPWKKWLTPGIITNSMLSALNADQFLTASAGTISSWLPWITNHGQGIGSNSWKL